MKKFIPIALVACLSAALLAGCGNNNQVVGITTRAPGFNPPPSIDALSAASPRETTDPEQVHFCMTPGGYWIVSLLSDVVLDRPLIIEGDHWYRDDPDTGRIARKLGLNTQNASYQVLERFTITVPVIEARSLNVQIQQGTVDGDIFVRNEGFRLTGVIVTGDLVFETQELFDVFYEWGEFEPGTEVLGKMWVGDYYAGEPVETPEELPSETPEEIPDEPADDECPTPAAEAPVAAAPATKYTPGTYSGRGRGYNGAVMVSVVVDEDTIVSITVTEHTDTAAFMAMAEPVMTERILAAQSFDVDTVTDATASALGILNGAKAAVAEATN